MRLSLILFGFSILIVCGGSLLPQKLHVQTAIAIQAPQQTVSAYLYHLPNWEKWTSCHTKDTNYYYSEFPQGVGAYMKWQNQEKGALYIQAVEGNENTQKIAYIANFSSYQTHLEGKFDLQTIQLNQTTSCMTVEIELRENPFVRYIAYLFFKASIQNEMQQSLENLKKLCEEQQLARH